MNWDFSCFKKSEKDQIRKNIQKKIEALQAMLVGASPNSAKFLNSQIALQKQKLIQLKQQEND